MQPFSPVMVAGLATLTQHRPVSHTRVHAQTEQYVPRESVALQCCSLVISVIPHILFF